MKSSLSEYISAERLNRIICLDETESTNTYLKTLPDAPDGLAVIARRQSAGRGRVGRSFASPEGGLYMSVLYRLDAAPAAFTACAALAVRRAIKRVCGLEAGVKWVNDLLIEGKKICGILTEMHSGALILGVGVNVNTLSFPQELPNAASLSAFAGREISVEALAAAILAELDSLRELSPEKSEEYRAEYASACLNLGREVLIVRGGSCRTAFAESIDGDFSLLVRYPDGTRESVFYGEVSLRGANGEYI